MLRAFDLFREAFGATEEKRVNNAKEIWRIAVEQMWSIGTSASHRPSWACVS